ncbi:Calx-beta domain-containing protein [Candidatus Halobeggiatoa sp. HSG11]|nr:Calx-beta domain-containing protein [Candidatus Halobeggiatoa sp. HSG11]
MLSKHLWKINSLLIQNNFLSSQGRIITNSFSSLKTTLLITIIFMVSTPIFADASLVINEINYDDKGADFIEYVELKNISGSTIDFSVTPYVLDLINGDTKNSYKTINIKTGTVDNNDYFVICGDNTTVPNCDFDSSPSTGFLQNDVEAIVLKLGGFIVDTVSYEGDVTGYVEGTAAGSDSHTIALISLSRFPDGTDTNNNNSDFALKCITPGTENNIVDSSGCYALSINDPIAITEGNNGNKTIDFTVSLSHAATQDITVDYATADNTATANSDYSSIASKTLTFPANNNTVQTVTVTINGDEIDEGTSETFYINLTNSSNNSQISDNQGTGTITDDDTAGLTVTETSGTLVNESGTTDTFTIVLDSKPTSDVEISIASGDIGETTVDKSSLFFTTGNWSIAQIITVTGVDDGAVSDGNQTTTVTLSVVDANSDDQYDTLTDTVNVTTVDNDIAGVAVSPTSLTVNELSGTASFTVKLNTQPSGSSSVTIPLSTSSNCTISPTTSITIASADWNTSKSVIVTAIDDAIDNATNRTCTITTGDPTSGDTDYGNLVANDVSNVSVSVQDDDIAGIDDVSGNINLIEGGATGSYDIKLSSQPSDDVEITVTANTQTAVSKDGGTNLSNNVVLTFTNGDWNIAQTITVQAIDDSAVEGNHISIISHKITGTVNDGNYPTTLILGNVTANITDNDNPPTTDTGGSSTPLPNKMTVFAKFAGQGSGIVTSSPHGINCRTEAGECKAEFDTASKMKLTVKPDSGSEFDRWSGKNCDTEIFLTSNRTCTAYFKLTPRTLTVSYPENSIIISSPQGINCGNNNQECSHKFEGGETINLSAIPNNDYILDSWSENCSDGKIQLLENATCSATLITKPAESVVITPVDPIVPDIIPPTTNTDSEDLTTSNVDESTILTNTVSFSEQNYEVAENAGQIEITATRIGIEGKVTVELWSSASDYNITETLVWNDGLDGDITVPITIIDNDIVDGNKEIILSLGNAENTKLELNTSVLTIIDDDKLPNISIDKITTLTTLPPLANNTCSSANILKTTCNFNWKDAKNILIEKQGSIGNAIIVTDINNQGRISNSKIVEDVQVTGGIVSGYITNLGTLSNFEFVGASITGMNTKGEIIGILSSKIFNNSKIGGSFENIRLAPNTHIIGGILKKTIIGDKKQPAILENLHIESKSYISNVIIAENVTYGESVIFTNVELRTKIAQLPVLGDSIVIDPYGNFMNTSSAKFTGGVSENGGLFQRKSTINHQSQITITSNLLVDVKHIGKQADILVVAAHTINGKNDFYMLNFESKPIIWNGNFADLIAFQSLTKLAPVEAIEIWNNPLDIAGSVMVYVGYRLADGRIVYSPKDMIEMDFVE